ncbi:MAG TPA: glycosyltransferase [Pyrinomonadaceae bacterium]|jgi:spore maturation protein CgeB
MTDALPNVAIHAVDFSAALPFFRPLARFVERAEEADFCISMNFWGDLGEAVERQREARRAGRPVAFWCAEDPNDFEKFLPQAREADVVFTTDEECVPRYKSRLGHGRVHWLPWACAPEIHRPLPLHEDARAFVLSANWYERFEARLWSVRTVVDPLVERGYGISLFCLEGWTMWPERYRKFWRGGPDYLTSSEQYRQGRVALGLNNQRSGMDGHGKTVMTSMRTFEVLASGKPFLSSHSDAYERLGFVNGVHMAWSSTPEETLHWAERLLGPDGERVARAGREFVLAHHTYAHRLRQIVEAVLG